MEVNNQKNKKEEKKLEGENKNLVQKNLDEPCGSNNNDPKPLDVYIFEDYTELEHRSEVPLKKSSTVREVKEWLATHISFIQATKNITGFGYFLNELELILMRDDDFILENENAYFCNVASLYTVEHKLKKISDQTKGRAYLAQEINNIESCHSHQDELFYRQLLEITVKYGYPLDKLRAKASKPTLKSLLSQIEELSGSPNGTPCSAMKSFLQYSLSQLKAVSNIQFKHTTNTGTLKENFAKLFVKKAINSQVLDYGTGEIFSPTAHCERQLDIVIYDKRKNPLMFNDEQSPCLYFAESVVAIIEVKANLQSKDMEAILSAATAIKAMNNHTKYFIFAYKSQVTEERTLMGYLQNSDVDGLFLLDGSSYRLLGQPPLSDNQYAHHSRESLKFYNSKVWAISTEPLVGLSVLYGFLVKLGAEDRWIDKYLFNVY